MEEIMLTQLIEELGPITNERSVFERLLPLIVPAINAPRVIQEAINLRRELQGLEPINFRRKSISAVKELSLELRDKLNSAQYNLMLYDRGLITFDIAIERIQRALDIEIDRSQFKRFGGLEKFDCAFYPAIIGFAIGAFISWGSSLGRFTISSCGGLTAGSIAAIRIEEQRRRIQNYEEFGRQVGQQIDLE
jgi:hypothetical protein